MSRVIVQGKQPFFNPWKAIDLVLKFWPVPLTLVGLLGAFLTNALAVALNYQGLLWIPMIISTLMAVGGAIAIVIYTVAFIFEWAEGGGMDDLRSTVRRKADEFGRVEDK